MRCEVDIYMRQESYLQDGVVQNRLFEQFKLLGVVEMGIGRIIQKVGILVFFFIILIFGLLFCLKLFLRYIYQQKNRDLYSGERVFKIEDYI